MGGKVFESPGSNGEPPLYTPRLSHEIYRNVKDQVLPVLTQYFSHIAPLIERPEKVNHGDLDLLVQGPNHSKGWADRPQFWRSLQHELGAPRAAGKGDGLKSFAVPIAIPGEDVATYAQVDVQYIGGNAETLHWAAFQQSYGDLWQILGLMLRSRGLLATDQGFFMRIAEIETVHWKKNRLFLSQDPVEVSRFLGLNYESYVQGFETLERLFEWISESRFYSLEAFEHLITNAEHQKRVKLRPMYAQFLNEWLPGPVAKERSKPFVDRGTTSQEILTAFNVHKEYSCMIAEVRAEQDEASLWSSIAQSIPSDADKTNLAIRGLKRWVKFEDAVPIILDVPVLEGSEQPKWTQIPGLDRTELLCWVKEHSEEIQTKEKARVKREMKRRKRLGKEEAQQTECKEATE